MHKISIVPRGRALGYTLNLPEEDRYLKTREELIDYMTVLLGGRAAEEIVFGAITTGASDDLSRVAEISRSMVHEYAMGTTITSRRVSPRAAWCPTARASCATRSSSTSPTRRCAARRGWSSATASSSTSSRGRLLDNEVLERATSTASCTASRASPARGNGLRVVAIEPTPEGRVGLGLHRAVADGLDVVAVGVEHERAVVVG